MWTSSAVGKLVVNFSRYLGHRASARLTLLAGLSISLLLFCQTALAQAVYGSSIGTIRESTGAVVPNATVTVTDTGRRAHPPQFSLTLMDNIAPSTSFQTPTPYPLRRQI